MINVSIFDNINWSNLDENSWVFIYIAIDHDQKRLHWFCQTKNFQNLFLYILFIPTMDFQSLNFTKLTLHDLNVGISNTLNFPCSCQIKYFTFYYEQTFFRDLINDIFQNEISKFCYLHLNCNLLKAALALININETYNDKIGYISSLSQKIFDVFKGNMSKSNVIILILFDYYFLREMISNSLTS